MKENFMYYLWENRLLSNSLTTTDGREVVILKTGSRNTNSGPDFVDARIKIGETLWAGNVEMHVLASDWFRHGHQDDKAYENVVLHVVYEYDTDKLSIPTLEIVDKFSLDIYRHYESFVQSQRWIPCEKLIDRVHDFTWMSWSERLSMERLESQCNAVMLKLEATHYDWEEVFYQFLMRYFGLKTNNEAFERLAIMLPLRQILKHADNLLQTEAFLFGAAGFLENDSDEPYQTLLRREFGMLRQKFNIIPMSSSQWKFMRMRPVNFPTLRIAQIAALFHQNGVFFHTIRDSPEISDIRDMFDVKVSEYWNTHYVFDKKSRFYEKRIGDIVINTLIINAIVPLLFCYGKYYGLDNFTNKSLSLLEETATENNVLIRKFGAIGIRAVNSLQSQGLMRLYEHYCRCRRCLECRIFFVLTSKKGGC